MRKNKKQIAINGEIYFMDDACREYIFSIEKKIRNIEHENMMLRGELEAIKPVLENKNHKPAMSKDCDECKYCVRSSWNGEVIGCRKDNVCEDFKLKGE